MLLVACYLFRKWCALLLLSSIAVKYKPSKCCPLCCPLCSVVLLIAIMFASFLAAFLWIPQLACCNEMLSVPSGCLWLGDTSYRDTFCRLLYPCCYSSCLKKSKNFPQCLLNCQAWWSSSAGLLRSTVVAYSIWSQKTLFINRDITCQKHFLFLHLIMWVYYRHRQVLRSMHWWK